MASAGNTNAPEEGVEWSELDDDLEELEDSSYAEVQRREQTALEFVEPEKVPQVIIDQLTAITGDANYLTHHRITNQQLKRLQQTGGILTGGVHRSSAMICTPNCMLKDRCPLHIMNRAPFQLAENDSECPVEQQLITQMETDYVEAYASRKNAEVSTEEVRGNRFIMDLIRELVETTILEQRINTKLARDGLLIDFAVAINNEGEMATNQDVSPLYKVKMGIVKRREGLRKQLLLTPEMELKKKIVDRIADPVSRDSSLTEKTKNLLNKAEKQLAAAIDAEIVRED